MELETMITLITILVSWILGVLSKKSKFISNKLIPIQNVLVGLIVAIIEFIITKDFEVAIGVSGLIAGGTYDIVHNLDKMIRKGE